MGSSEERSVTLALDAEGGDHAPAEIVAGALAVASPRLHVLLVGRPEVLGPLVPEGSADVEIVESEGTISSLEEPAKAVRSRPRSSIAVGARTVAEGRADGFVGAGSTGAMLAAGLLLVKRVRGVKRPAIVTVLPGSDGPLVLLDAGANADCRPEHLLEFGMLGSVFARLALDIAQPRVGLLNIGEEKTKGNELALGAYPLLAASGLNFVGNVEGRDLLFGAADVVVTDGFTGNVALKLLEGTARAMLTRIGEAARRDVRSRVGGALLRPALRSVKAALDPEEYGGTYLLGLRGLVVICHGNSSRRAIANALEFGARAVRQGVVETVERELGASGDA
ncbi:MAG TPA: phosphate acyltransferase PlsX [Thermoleophilia bacterium]|nr:phosphate acyltransferase PlsX [Thermoleophilia bacterium]